MKNRVELLARVGRAISRVCLKKYEDGVDSMKTGGYHKVGSDDSDLSEKTNAGKLDELRKIAKENAVNSDGNYDDFNVIQSGFHGMNQK